MKETSLRAVVVDDEAPARALLREYLAAVDGVEVVAECRDGFEAVRAVSELAPDLLVLDIQMPRLDGFDVLELLDEPPAVIFSTAYDEHAVRAFEVAAVDYLLKPFSLERLAEAVQRVREQRSGAGSAARSALLEAGGSDRTAGRILVREGGQVHIVTEDRLDYVETLDDYVLLHVGERSLRKKQTLKSLVGQLDAARFVRVHRCFVLNLDRLDRLEPYSRESRVAVLRDGTRLPVSRTGYRRLKDRLTGDQKSI